MGKQRPLVGRNVNVTTLFEKKNAATYKLIRFGTKINCTSAENKVRSQLDLCEFEYYTPNFVKAQAAHIIKRRGEHFQDESSIHFSKGVTNLKKLREVKASRAHPYPASTNRPGRRPVRKSPAAPLPAPPNSLAATGSSIVAGSQPASYTGTYPRRIDPRLRAGMLACSSSTDPSPEGNNEVLFSSAELWSIFTKFHGRIQCKNRSDQINVLGYMVCKYRVN